MDVLVNAAMSVDGKLSTRERQQVEISGPADFERVDELRAERDAVMVGVGTVLADDPSLTLDSTALVGTPGARRDSPQPTRIVADSRGRTPREARVLDDRAETILLVSAAAPTERVDELAAAGATVLVAGENRVDLSAAFVQLESEGIESMLVEGGGELLFSLFEAGHVDRLSIYVGSMVIGGRDAPTLVDGAGLTDDFVDLTLDGVERLDEGVLLQYDVVDASG